MTLLEVVKNASVNKKSLDSPPDCPIVLNPDYVIPNLMSKQEEICPSSLVKPLAGWRISQTDAEVIDIGKKFSANLNEKLKSTDGFENDEFIGILNSYLENIRDKVGVSIGIDSSNSNYTRILIDRLGFLMDKSVSGLVLQGCVSLDMWELVEALIINGMVEHSCYLNLAFRLVEKKRSDLLILYIKYALNLGSSEILCILKYFHLPSKDAY